MIRIQDTDDPCPWVEVTEEQVRALVAARLVGRCSLCSDVTYGAGHQVYHPTDGRKAADVVALLADPGECDTPLVVAALPQ